MITIALLSSAFAQEASPISISPWTGAAFQFNNDGASLVASGDGPLGEEGRLAMQLTASVPASIIGGDADGTYKFVFGVTTLQPSKYMDLYLREQARPGSPALLVEMCLEFVEDLDSTFVVNDWFDYTKLTAAPTKSTSPKNPEEIVTILWKTLEQACELSNSDCKPAPTPALQKKDGSRLDNIARTAAKFIEEAKESLDTIAVSASNPFQIRDGFSKGGPTPVQGFFRVEGEWDRQTLGTTTSPLSTSDWYGGTASLSGGFTGSWGYEGGALTQFGFDSAFGIGRVLATNLVEVCPEGATSGSAACDSVDAVNTSKNRTTWNGRALLKVMHSGREISDKFAYVPGVDFQTGWRGEGNFNDPDATPTHRFEAQAAATFRSLSQAGVLIAAGVNVQYALGGDAELEGWNVKPVILFGAELPSIGAGQRAKGKKEEGEEPAGQGAGLPENPSNGPEPKTPQPNADKTPVPGADAGPQDGNAPEAKAQ